MRKLSVSFCIGLLCFATVSAQTGNRMGLGVATNFGISSLGYSQTPIYQNAAKVSFDLGNIRFEPVLAYASGKTTTSNPDNSSQFNSSEYSSAFVGVNLLVLFQKENSHFFIGAGIGRLIISQEYEYRSGNSFDLDTYDLSGLAITPLVGGEYFLSTDFALGVELSYQFTNLDGEIKNEGSGQITGTLNREFKSSTVGAYFTARYFLNY